MTDAPSVTVHTDGACVGNPGAGGYAAVVVRGGVRTELSGGRRLTTNNRMEMLAAVVALESLGGPCRVTVFSDSRYLVDAVMNGWAQRWRANGWKRNRDEYAVNTDLWARLLDLCRAHAVAFVWVRGHAGDTENERCDRLAVAASGGKDLPPDDGYERQLAAAAARPSLFDAAGE